MWINLSDRWQSFKTGGKENYLGTQHFEVIYSLVNTKKSRKRVTKRNINSLTVICRVHYNAERGWWLSIENTTSLQCFVCVTVSVSVNELQIKTHSNILVRILLIGPGVECGPRFVLTLKNALWSRNRVWEVAGEKGLAYSRRLFSSKLTITLPGFL